MVVSGERMWFHLVRLEYHRRTLALGAVDLDLNTNFPSSRVPLGKSLNLPTLSFLACDLGKTRTLTS